jgi:hypothetical protein
LFGVPVPDYMDGKALVVGEAANGAAIREKSSPVQVTR